MSMGDEPLGWPGRKIRVARTQDVSGSRQRQEARRHYRAGAAAPGRVVPSHAFGTRTLPASGPPQRATDPVSMPQSRIFREMREGLLSLDLTTEPGAGIGPEAVGRAGRDAHCQSRPSARPPPPESRASKRQSRRLRPLGPPLRIWVAPSKNTAQTPLFFAENWRSEQARDALVIWRPPWRPFARGEKSVTAAVNCDRRWS